MSKQSARGPHPKDAKLFGSTKPIHKLQQAVSDLSWLLSKSYPENAALKLVGDRYKLTKRQRLAVRRCANSDEAVAWRQQTRVLSSDIDGAIILVDGFNIIITVETLISGGYLFVGKDHVIRDISGVHGSYKLLGVTRQAIEILVKYFKSLRVAKVQWYFDQPVSNSGRLSRLTGEICRTMELPATTETLFNPDKHLTSNHSTVLTSDSEILNHSKQWLDISELYFQVDKSRIVDLSQVAEQ